MIQVLIINLNCATDRLSFQTAQMAALGIDSERVPAVDIAHLPLKNEAFWSSWERPMRIAEQACFLSHYQVWQRVAAGSKPVFIMEDDAVLSKEVPKLLARVETVQGIDHLTLETRGRKKLLARKQHAILPIRRLYQDRSGAAAYVLWPSGATKLLARTRDHAAITDAVICAAYELASFQADPALAIQLDRCLAYGLPESLKTQSSISKEYLPRKKSLRYRFRRLVSQARMGLRQLAHSLDAERRLVHIEPTDFVYLEKPSKH